VGLGRTFALNTSAPEVRGFIDSITAVPEPSSILLLGFSTVVGYSRFRKRRKTLKATGLFAAVMVLIVSGVAVKRADAGMVTSASAIPVSEAVGASRVVANGGNLGWFSVEFTSPTTLERQSVFSSATLLGDGRTIVNNTHQYLSFLNSSPVFSFGTGSNYSDSLLRGDVYRVQSWALDPNFVNTNSLASTHGLAVGILEFQVPNVNNIRLATSAPSVGTVAQTAGFGRPAVNGVGFLPVTGRAMGGDMAIVGPGGNFDPNQFTRTIFRDNSPSDISLTGGNSGSPVIFNNELVAIGAASNGLGGASWSALVSSGPASSFIAQNSFTAVPEPSSLLMLGAASAGAYSLRRYRKRRKTLPSTGI